MAVAAIVGATVAAFAWVGCGPATTGCTSDADCAQGQVCKSDGTCTTLGDNNGNNGIDAGTREGAGAPHQCYDVVDNDGDGLVDCADPDCGGLDCRPALGMCDVVEKCTAGVCPANLFKEEGTECAPASCANDTFTARRACDAFGSCESLSPTSCLPFTCDDTGCKTACASNSDCGAGFRCYQSTCVSATSLQNGEACSMASQCGSGNCVDGVCCDTACDGACEACDLNGGGTCTPVAAGEAGDPACAPFVCNGTSAECPTSCTSNADCGGGLVCSNGACLQPNGAVCSGAAECASGFCTDGVCCNTACGGACEACDLNGGGTCTPVAAGEAGTPACAPFVCNGASGACPTSCTSNAQCAGGLVCSNGACLQPNGAVCSGAAECASGFCSDGVCCNSACTGSCNACDRTGSVGTCSNLPAGSAGSPSCAPYLCTGGSTCGTTCTTGANCAAGNWCSNGTCLPKKANGLSCATATECTSGSCVDGVCCNTACNGTCQSCNLTGSVGTCSNIPDNTDPANECGGYTCNGAGACATSCAGNTCSSDCKSSQWCNNGACVADKANSNGCTAGCECSSGVCSTFYQDQDGDGYGKSTVTAQFCGTTPPTGFANQAGDCCDSDNRARPGQTAYFTTPRTGCGGYDFNCNGSDDRERTGLTSCPGSSLACGFGDCFGSNTPGWGGTVPSCGATGTWRTCNTMNCITPDGPDFRCAVSSSSITQGCR